MAGVQDQMSMALTTTKSKAEASHFGDQAAVWMKLGLLFGKEIFCGNAGLAYHWRAGSKECVGMQMATRGKTP